MSSKIRTWRRYQKLAALRGRLPVLSAIGIVRYQPPCDGLARDLLSDVRRREPRPQRQPCTTWARPLRGLHRLRGRRTDREAVEVGHPWRGIAIRRPSPAHGRTAVLNPRLGEAMAVPPRRVRSIWRCRAEGRMAPSPGA